MDKPAIRRAEEKTSEEETDWDRVAKRMAAQELTAQKLQKKLSRPVRKELDRLSIKLPGFSRVLNTDWYLNDKRYKEYQELTRKMLEKEIPVVISMPTWKQFDRQDQKDMLEELIKDVKASARQQVVDKAYFEDLERGRPNE
jgi:hypothetical protein